MSWYEKIVGWLFSWSVEHQQAQRARRRQVRKKLVEFNEHVDRVGWGGWAGIGEAARPEWENDLTKTRELRGAVVQTLYIDRKTAGLDWCRDVEDCLEKGWRLVHNCYGQCMLPPGGRRQKEHNEYESIRDAYHTAYKKVTEE